MALRTIVVALFAVSACKGPHVPGDYQGNTQITIVNAYELPMCEFNIWTGDENNDENWLGTGSRVQSVPPGGSRVYSVKPGTYHVGGGFCNASGLTAAAGTNGQSVTIDGTTTIVLGPSRTPSRLHEKRIVFSDVMSLLPANNYNAPAEATGEAPEAPAACEKSGAQVDSVNDCCSSHAHQNPGPNGQLAGQPYFCD